MDTRGANGSQRKLTEAWNRVNPHRIRLFPEDTASGIRATAPDAPTHMDTAEDHRIPRKLTETRKWDMGPQVSAYFMEIPCLDFGIPYPTPGEIWTQRTTTEADGKGRKLKIGPTTVRSEYFREIPRQHFRYPHQTPRHIWKTGGHLEFTESGGS